jgi:hypothetical protein
MALFVVVRRLIVTTMQDAASDALESLSLGGVTQRLEGFNAFNARFKIRF